MPALTPAQRKKQQELQRQAEAKQRQRNKPKPGQKGAPTSGGSRTKAETIGGAKPQPAASRPSAGRPTSRFAGARDANLKRINNDPRFAAPTGKPSTQSNNTSTSNRRSNSGGSSSSTTSTRTTSPTSSSPTLSKIPTVNETYRDGGKGFYQGTEEYRNKVGGSGNPLLNRFRKDMGRDEATGDKVSNITNPEAPKPGSVVTKDAPNGKQYYGPAYGERSGPAKPASPNDKPDVGYKAKPIKSPDYSSSKTTNRTNTAFGAKNNLLEELRKRRTGQ